MYISTGNALCTAYNTGKKGTLLAGIFTLGDRQAVAETQSSKTNGISTLQCALFAARKAAAAAKAIGNESLERKGKKGVDLLP